MDAKSIRHKFLNFFQDKGHTIVASAPIVLKHDPTLMFTNAGMNQFKDFFLGNKKAEASRVADTQKCLRVSGKHNDLEEVGIDTYHHTMFEMLGNWSFGDYFKEDAIAWAWELLTGTFGLPEDRLYVTVFEGDEGDQLAFDQEAYDFWKAIVAKDKILRGNKKDNFWEMGDTGPCGPCSEIHIDLRSEEEIRQIPGADLVNNDHPLVVEIWNLVFMQYNRLKDNSLQPLPQKHVDTGMGFERLVMAIQGKKSNYDTDVFQPLIQHIAQLSGHVYGKASAQDIAMRVIADHIRAIAFCIADGQLPSNNKAGYVIRRILRRAVRYGYTFLELKSPFLHTLVDILSDQFNEVFPELNAQKSLITKVIKEEEQSFLRTLENGLKRLDQVKENIAGKTDVIDGATAFELYDTFGFPLDLTALIAKESNLTVDEDGFNKAMQKQKDRSKSAAKTETSDWVILEESNDVEFLGYDTLETTATVVKYREVSDKKQKLFQVVLDQTPFYAESGGQVGDKGTLEINGKIFQVIDTQKENDLIIHILTALPELVTGFVHAKVDATRRQAIMQNHSATHLLHAALKETLGDHVQQRGSLVAPDELRFDFSHFSKMTDEELAKVEARVNAQIRANISLDEARNVPIGEAKDRGATALFGEKYGDFVRVITFDPDFSVELCGGTHVNQTAVIGQFIIVQETSVAAGIRRIVAFTGEMADKYVKDQLNILSSLKQLLKHPKDVVLAVQNMQDEKNKLVKSLELLQQEQAGQVKNVLLGKVEQLNDVNLIVAQVNLPNADALKTIAFQLKQQVDNLLLVLAADIDGKPQIAVMIADDLVKAKNLHAGKMVKSLSSLIKGGGGGQPFFATAGGKDLAGLGQVVNAARQLIADQI